jgi:hypothetical protein
VVSLPQTSYPSQTTYILTQKFVPFREILRACHLVGLLQCALADGFNDKHRIGFRSSASLQSCVASLCPLDSNSLVNKMLLLITAGIGKKLVTAFAAT